MTPTFTSNFVFLAYDEEGRVVICIIQSSEEKFRTSNQEWQIEVLPVVEDDNLQTRLKELMPKIVSVEAVQFYDQ